MKRFLIFFVFFLAAGFFVHQSLAQTRYAACDQCGYCPPNPPPNSWPSCQECLYPSINPDPNAKESLIINPQTNLPTALVIGHQFTFLGCISTGAGSLSQEKGVVQVLLKTVFSIVGGIAFLYLLYGAFVLATSQDDPEKLNYGKRLVSGAIIGLIFSLTSVLLVNFLASQVLKIPGFG